MRTTPFAAASVALAVGLGVVAAAGSGGRPADASAFSTSNQHGTLEIKVTVTSAGEEPWDGADSTHNAKVRPGDAVSYRVRVSPTDGTVEDVTAHFDVTPQGWNQNLQISCPDDGDQSPNGCRLGDVSEKVRIPISVDVPDDALDGQEIRLTAKATAGNQPTSDPVSSTSAKVVVVREETAQPSPTPSQTKSSPSQPSPTRYPNSGSGAGPRPTWGSGPSGSGDSITPRSGDSGGNSPAADRDSSSSSRPAVRSTGSGDGSSAPGTSSSESRSSVAGMADLQALSAPNPIASRTPAPTPQLAPTPRLPEITPDRAATSGPQRSEAAGLVPGTSAGIPRELLVLAGAVSGAVLGIVMLAIAHLVRHRRGHRQAEPAQSPTLGGPASSTSSERRVRHRRRRP